MTARVRAVLALVALIVLEVGAVAALVWSSSVQRWQVDRAHLWRWLDGPPLDVAGGLARVLLLFLVGWLCLTTALYLLAAATRARPLMRLAAPVTLPGIRRLVEGSVAVTMTATVLMRGGAAMAAPGPAGGWADRTAAAAAPAPVVVSEIPPAVAPTPTVAGSWTVAGEDNLWAATVAILAHAKGVPPEEIRTAEIVPYWEALIEANIAHLASGDPDLIFTGEVLTLPPLPMATVAAPAPAAPPAPAPVAAPAVVEPVPDSVPAPAAVPVTAASTPEVSVVSEPASDPVVVPDSAPVVDPVPTASGQPSASTGIPAWGLMGGGLLAAGFVAAIATRRRPGRRRRDDNQETPALTADLQATELAALVGADVGGARFVETALRAMAAGLGDDPEAPLGLVLDGASLTVIQAEESPAPAPFTTRGNRWVLSRRVDMAELTEQAGPSRPMPIPALVTLGRTAEGAEVFANAEDAGLISVDGPGGRELVSAAGVQLSTAPWEEAVRTVLVGFPSAPTGRHVVAVDRLDEALMDRLDAEAAAMAEMLMAAECGSTFATRAAEIAPDSWLPTVVVCLEPLPDDVARRLVMMCSSTARAGVAALVVGHAPGAPWVLDIVDGRLDVPDLGVAVAVAGLSDDETASVADVLANADAEPIHVAPVPPPPLEEVETPAYQVLVRVIGTLVVEGCGRIQQTKGREAFVYLATHAGMQVDGDRLIESLWPGSDPATKRRSFHTRMSELRADLGESADGRPYLPALAGSQRLYVVSDAVGTDVDVIRAAMTRDRASADDEGLAGLRAALELVRGVPFDRAGRGYEWARAEGLERQVEIVVTDAAHRLSTRCRENGDHEGAAWAANQGLVAFPDHERLFRDLMLAWAAMGNAGGVERVYNDLLDRLGDDEPAPETVSAYRQLVQTARSA